MDWISLCVGLVLGYIIGFTVSKWDDIREKQSHEKDLIDLLRKDNEADGISVETIITKLKADDSPQEFSIDDDPSEQWRNN